MRNKNLGIFIAIVWLCVCSTIGVGDSFEETEAKAKASDIDAQVNLGWMYANGGRVAKDDAQAVKWYRKVAQAGVADAQFNLGMRYTIGQGVPRDDNLAVKWLRKGSNGLSTGDRAKSVSPPTGSHPGGYMPFWVK